MLMVLVAVLVGWVVVSVVLALGFGRAVRLAESRTPGRPASFRPEPAPLRPIASSLTSAALRS